MKPNSTKGLVIAFDIQGTLQNQNSSLQETTRFLLKFCHILGAEVWIVSGNDEAEIASFIQSEKLEKYVSKFVTKTRLSDIGFPDIMVDDNLTMATVSAKKAGLHINNNDNQLDMYEQLGNKTLFSLKVN